MEKIAANAMTKGVTTCRDGEEVVNTNDAGSKMPLKQFNQQRLAMHGVGQKCFQQHNAFQND